MHALKSLSTKDGAAEVTLVCGGCRKEFKKTLPASSLNGGLVACPRCRTVGLLRTGIVIGDGKPDEEPKEKEP